MNNRILSAVLLILLVSGSVSAQKTKKAPGQVWPTEKAREWYSSHKWLTGANYIPSNAINQLEMWQGDTFSPDLIDKELGLAQGIGFNTLRVFLYSKAYQQDPEGFLKRVDQFLAIADKHQISPMLVFFDDCWNKTSAVGKQPEVKTGVHNSGWLQDPGDPASREEAGFAELERYVKAVMNRFANDKRVLLWDLYNEPGNSGKLETTIPLLMKTIEWARAVNPSQPISIGLWNWGYEKLNALQIANSDVVTYHNYEAPDWHQRTIDLLKTGGRPMICTEYMARSRNSRFSNILPLLKKENVGAINWGFVSGKTNTKYAWDTPLADGSEPLEWFHEIFNPDGTPYRRDETELIKKLNAK
ncbi:cellulase family glycosylhydrolase [Pedobacter mucosus]|uniref:cellulase family glycosylhydrolase n=1 Tax=Pedobacter mucosus TaxID=2895286 RepID=UPI001EE4485C|nr:cellulase family glycosylhydrolase [Pedobacter mucosus]UKT65034.1 glycoside hydrolase family 5 protein [Pedobacter mucosus]